MHAGRELASCPILYMYTTHMGVEVDSLGRTFIVIDNDTLHTAFLPQPELMHTGPLHESDYEEIAKDLGIETAAIRSGRNRNRKAPQRFQLRRLGDYQLRPAGISAVPLQRGHQPRTPLRQRSPHRSIYRNTARNRQRAARRLNAAIAIDSVAAIEKHLLGHVPDWRIQLEALRSRFPRRICGAHETVGIRPTEPICQLHTQHRLAQSTSKSKKLGSICPSLQPDHPTPAEDTIPVMAAAYRKYKNETYAAAHHIHPMGTCSAKAVGL